MCQRTPGLSLSRSIVGCNDEVDDKERESDIRRITRKAVSKVVKEEKASGPMRLRGHKARRSPVALAT